MNIKCKRSLLIVVTGVFTLSGCVSGTVTEQESNSHSLIAGSNYPMNQPVVKKVVVVGEATKTVDEINEIALMNHPLETLSENNEFVPVPTVAKEQQIITSIDSSKTFKFSLLKGESYKSALYRWLNHLGYKKIGLLLNDEYEYKINDISDRDMIMTTTANKAMNYLVDAVNKSELTENQEKKLSLKDYTTNPDENLHVEFNGDDEAIITTSQLPVTMFEVKRGDVLTNYLRLGNDYGWNVNTDFYLASNYEVPFDFLVVTEEGNVQSALEQFLEAYPGLTAGTYEAKREIYIQSVER